ncbi:MAG: YbgA family protein [Candidatus Woesearchaeota archaeon]
MKEFVKAKLVISRCLGFDNCRYNGQILKNDFIESLKNYTKIITVCPERDIGLEVPRNSLRLVVEDENLKIIDKKANKDYSSEMKNYSKKFLKTLNNVDGFILKNRSPSCAINDGKIYNAKNGSPFKTDSGFFTNELKKEFPYMIMEDEGRLTNLKIREDFLSKIFLKADFNNIKSSLDIKELIDFHSRNKYLLLTFDENNMRKLGKIVANHNKDNVKKIFNNYEIHLNKALANESSYTKNINVLMHTLGYFKDKLSSEEKSFFLDQLEKYRENKVHLKVPLNIIKSWIIKYNEKYLKRQRFFNPYPEELMDLKDSAKNQR